MAKTKLRDLVVILPGITGSALQKDGKDLWAMSGQAAWQALSTRGKTLEQLKLDNDDPDVEDLEDGIQAVRVVEDVHFVPGLIKIDGYTAIWQAIVDYFDVTPGKNLFAFPYDWRRDNRASARALKRFVDERLKNWRESSGADDAKVILLAHSMGGLVSRYYLEVLEGWQDCRALFTFGTPHRGSVNAVNFLANGYKQLFFDFTEVLRSLPSVYQLMPIYPMLKIGDKYHRVAEAPVNLPNIIKPKAENALKFHNEIRDAVNNHRQDAEYLANSYKIIPIVGTKQPTLQSASLKENSQIEVSRELPDGADSILSSGDGTVPYVSAIPIELSHEYRQTYIAERHSSIQNHGQVLDQLCNQMAAMQIKGIENFQNPGRVELSREPAAISLDLDDLYIASNEAVELRAKILNTSESFGKLKARITSVLNEDFSQRADFQEQGNQWFLHLDGLPEGLYRLEVRAEKGGAKSPMPVHDLFEVVK